MPWQPRLLCAGPGGNTTPNSYNSPRSVTSYRGLLLPPSSHTRPSRETRTGRHRRRSASQSACASRWRSPSIAGRIASASPLSSNCCATLAANGPSSAIIASPACPTYRREGGDRRPEVCLAPLSHFSSARLGARYRLAGLQSRGAHRSRLQLQSSVSLRPPD